MSALAGRRPVVPVALAAVAATGLVLSIAVGDIAVSPVDAARAVAGTADPLTEFVVTTLRLPRAVNALLVGAAFGLSGALFQWLARNPLASPDLIGVSAGAGLGAVAVIVLGTAAAAPVAGGAVVGALAATAAVYLLAHRDGVSGHRFVLVGIAVAAALVALTQWLLTRADIGDTQRALVWLTGSVNGSTWARVATVGLGLAVLGPVAFALTRRLRVLALGDELARGLGVRVDVTRLVVIVAAVGLAAAATAAAGPVGFVALLAPQIGRALTGRGSPALAASMFAGAALVVVSDVVGRSVVPGAELPVGIVTSIIGAPYLLLVLARAGR